MNAALTTLGVVFIAFAVLVVVASPGNILIALLLVLAACVAFGIGSHLQKMDKLERHLSGESTQSAFICKKCGARLAISSRFCDKCGAAAV